MCRLDTFLFAHKQPHSLVETGFAVGIKLERVT